MLPKCWPDYLKTAISGIFPVPPTGKKFFTRNGYHHSLNTINTHLWAKNHKKTNDKILRKVQKTVISGIFPAFSPGKFFFRKSGSVIFWALLIRIFVQKIRKTNDESSRKCQKTGFSGIFPAFSAGKMFFPEIGLPHIFGIAILHLCAKNQKKTNEPIPRKAGNSRTDGQRLIYRTSSR